MSEAMTNSEIEDVLSSIRRLVAQETRPLPSRLVLTEAQRVTTGEVAPVLPPVTADPPVPANISGKLAAHAQGAGVVNALPENGTAPEPEGLEDEISALESATSGWRASDADGESVATREPTTEENVAEIDEAELGRLIARLVRDELHGQLGERITLQVRKLVRAEIARALDERNLLP